MKVRLFVKSRLNAGEQVPLEPSQAHYLFKALRLRQGDEVCVFNGLDGEWRSSLLAEGRGRGTLEVVERLRAQIQEPDIWLAFAPLKKTPMDFVIEKATELGASLLWPVYSRNTATKRINQDRLHANATEAAQQCRRLSVPEIRDAVTLEDFSTSWPRERPLYVLDEKGSGAPIADVFGPPGDASTPPIAGFLSGPEGGFERFELDALGKLPFVTPVHLGPRILRAETAALSALAVWQALAGDWPNGPDN